MANPSENSKSTRNRKDIAQELERETDSVRLRELTEELFQAMIEEKRQKMQQKLKINPAA